MYTDFNQFPWRNKKFVMHKSKITNSTSPVFSDHPMYLPSKTYTTANADATFSNV